MERHINPDRASSKATANVTQSTDSKTACNTFSALCLTKYQDIRDVVTAMRYVLSICTAILLGMGTKPVSAQALTEVECRQILQTYGILPASCHTPESLQNAAAAAPARPLTAPTQEMRQNNIFFSQGQDRLTQEAMSQLQKLADILNSPTMSHACIKLVGHSDSSGSELINIEVGTKRAVAVRNQLALMIQNPARIEVLNSMGENNPLAGLPAESPWQRRVEIWARNCPGMHKS